MHSEKSKPRIRPAVLALGASLPMFMAASPSSALNIALTNDDGWNAAGIQALRDALVEASHTVVLVGPAQNQSGTSAASDLGVSNLRITKQVEDGNPNGGSDQYSVALSSGASAKPATAALVAISIAQQSGTPVDLLISGINAGANIGAWTNVSGTVGAALHAISYLKGYSVPAIAISTDERISDDLCPEGQEESCAAANLEHYKKVAAWMVKLVATLEQKPGLLRHEDGLLPRDIALNINYPTYVITGRNPDNTPIYTYVEQINGVQLASQGKLAYAGGIPRAYPVGCYADCLRAPVGTPIRGGITSNPEVTDVRESRFADTIVFSEGKVSIVPITADLSAGFFDALQFHKLIHQLNRP